MLGPERTLPMTALIPTQKDEKEITKLNETCSCIGSQWQILGSPASLVADRSIQVLFGIARNGHGVLVKRTYCNGQKHGKTPDTGSWEMWKGYLRAWLMTEEEKAIPGGHGKSTPALGNETSGGWG